MVAEKNKQKNHMNTVDNSEDSTTKPARLVICMPISSSGFIHEEAAEFCTEMAKRGAKRYVFQSICPEIERNLAIEKILRKTPAPTHIFCLGSDIVPPVDAIKRLLAHDKDIVGGIYPLWDRNKIIWGIQDELSKSLFKTDHVVGGAMLVKIEVFKKIGFPFYKNEVEQISKTSQTTGFSIIAEDVYFSTKVRKHGFEIWCDPTVKCKHFKTVDLLEISESMTEKQR